MCDIRPTCAGSREVSATATTGFNAALSERWHIRVSWRPRSGTLPDFRQKFRGLPTRALRYTRSDKARGAKVASHLVFRRDDFLIVDKVPPS